MRKVILVVFVLAMLSLSAAAFASDTQWVISIKAVNATFGGHTVTQMGVGGNAELATSGFANESAGTIIRENTAAYGDTTAYHSYHDTAVMADPQSYSWDLKVGAKGADVLGARIYMWNNKTPQGAKGGELNHSLAYAFQKKIVGQTGYQTLAWFSDAATQATLTNVFGDNGAGTWHDASVLIQLSSAWAPSSTLTGFYITQDLIAGGSYAELADYRLIVSSAAAPIIPEPASLLALGSGLVGFAGFALRRRKS